VLIVLGNAKNVRVVQNAQFAEEIDKVINADAHLENMMIIRVNSVNL
jgi:hypothetical protein